MADTGDTTADRLAKVLAEIAEATGEAGRAPGSVELIAVSKTFDAEHIRPALEAGHRIFGENRVQEAQGKWPGLKADYTDCKLHLIGPLQSNKSRDAVALFDVVHTVDRDKIAGALAKEMAAQDRRLKLFVQVNTGEEPQKAGIPPKEAEAFVARCRDHHGLEIAGLMCIPPVEENPGPHFALLKKLADRCGLAELSCGMSADYRIAIEMGATCVRVGSAIFGSRG